MPTILHVLDRLTGAGPTRSLIALARHLSRLEPSFRHRVVALQREAYPHALVQARQAGLAVLRQPGADALRDEVAAADIVHVHYWSNPALSEFLDIPLPAHRRLLWLKIAGHAAPQAVTPALLERFSFCVATAARTLDLPALAAWRAAGRAACVPGIAEFERLDGLIPAPHEGVHAGYLGTVNFSKMHAGYVAMSAATATPGLRFIVCGAGGGAPLLREQAAACGAAARFEFRDFVEDIRPVLAGFDILGYPLCEDTYATSEKSMQEAMAAGIPPVVFPYGGLRELVTDGETGRVVHTPAEYTAALDTLAGDAALRRRLGAQARAHVRDAFAPERAAAAFAAVYRRVLDQPRIEYPVLPGRTGAERFLAAVGDTAPQFARSRAGRDAASEARIMASSSLLATGEGGVLQFRNRYPDDAWLRFWAALVLLGQGRRAAASAELNAAVELGLEAGRAEPHRETAGGGTPA